LSDLIAPADVALPADGFALFPDRSVVALRVRGELKDLATVVDSLDGVEPVTVSSPDGLNILRHSTAHILAQAVQRVRPQANLGIGPPITDGFYYDFGVDEPFTPEDLKAIKKEMERIVREGQRFVRRVVTDDEARAELADEPFKLELIGLKGGSQEAAEGASVEVGAGELTIYDNVTRDGETAWKDLCRGPHVPSTRVAGNGWDLTRVAGAYWRGSEKNPQLQRIYGTAWPTKDELRAYQQRLEEAAKRDHRKLGKDLDLFSFPEEIGPGLSVFHPKGGIIRYEIERYMRESLLANGYQVVNTPHITKGDLFMTSGHLQWYADGMYPPMVLDEVVDADGHVSREGQEYYLKPMNCPFHNLIFRSRGRSYRELPLRLSEFGSVYRYEKSGTLAGLTRVRGMTQDDTHIYVTADQVKGELEHSLAFVLQTLRDYGLNDFYLELSTKEEGNPKFIGDDSLWEEATQTLREVAEGSGLELVPDPGGAAFYGPKISVQARDAIGRTWQMSTIQLDFNQPERFELARLQPARAVRARVHGPRRREAPSRHDPPCAVRLDRALLRDPPRALCRGLPGVARPGPGRRHPRRRGVRPVSGRDRRATARRWRPCRGRPLRRPDAEEDPDPHDSEGAAPAHRGGAGPLRRHGLVPLPRRIADQRHPGR